MNYKDIFEDTIELTDERWVHIVNEHPEVKQYGDRIGEVLANPDYVKKSIRDPQVLLYYRFFEDIFMGKYMLIATKKGFRSFVLTCYITDTIKKGVTVWERK